jgi:predicted alpha/beta-fold hydrolase
METTELTFYSDGFLLKGILHSPLTENPPLIVGSHGLFASSQSPKQISLANECTAKGMAFFRFDHRGCGDSDGDFYQVTSLEGRCRDLINAVQYLQQQGFAEHGLGLFGSSLGGTTCLYVSKALSPNALVINAAPVQSGPAIESLETKASPSSASKKSLRFDITPLLSKQHHILVFHGDMDELVPVSNGKHIYDHAFDPKRIILLEGGDHSMSNPEHQKTFATESTLWFQKYLMP